jgi:DNA repair exonuclease SbcCD ATPase subunit
MESDQVLKRLQWIEEDRRKEKDAISLVENRVAGVEGALKNFADQIKQLGSDITHLSAVLTRMDQFDGNLLQQRLETRRMVDELEKDVRKRAEDSERQRVVEIRAIDTNIADLRKELEVIPRLEKGISVRVEEESRLRRAIDELGARIEGVRRDEEEYTRTYRLLEDGRRQDAKRITDLQGEVAALRKMADSQRGQIEIVNTTQRRQETRLNELVTVESERRDAMSNFLDKQAMSQVERERTWKDWQSRFETIERQAGEIEKQLVGLDATHRETRRAQTLLEELSQKVERRLNELTEVQRLSEDRFRQEWVTFKADDQKRWTNYTLTQEEQRSEIGRQFERLDQQINHIADGLQEIQDLYQQVNELSEKRLQSLLALAHEWNTTYERTVGRR